MWMVTTRQIDILERNPKKDPSKYTDEDLQHMRKGADLGFSLILDRTGDGGLWRQLMPPPVDSCCLLRSAHQARKSHAGREIGRGARKDKERPLGESSVSAVGSFLFRVGLLLSLRSPMLMW